MNRLVPTLLSIAAVVGLMLPPVQIVHAHDEGHEPHSHGTLHAGHVAHAHEHVHPHPHRQADVDPVERDVDPDVDLDVEGEGESHPHAHLVNAPDAIARARDGGQAIDGSIAEWTAFAAAIARCAAPRSVEPDGPAPSGRRDAPRPSPRSIDRLIVIGRLLI